MAKIDVLLDVMVQHGASDLHISAGTPPMLRIDGELQRTKYHDLSPEEVEILLLELMDDEQLKLLKERMDIDFAYEIKGVARFRANVSMERNGYGGSFRLIPTKINTIRELNAAGICPNPRRRSQWSGTGNGAYGIRKINHVGGNDQSH